MRSRKWNKNSARMLAGVLTVGMMTVQPAAVFAAGGQTAVDQSGQWVQISESVLGMLSSGMVYQDSGTGCLYDRATGQRVDPVSGVKFNEQPRVPDSPAGQETPKAPETPEVPESPEPPDSSETPEPPADPDIPGNPETPDKPVNPDAPDNPDIPANPDTPDNPETPDKPEVPDIPANPDIPSDPDVPDLPSDPDDPDSPETPDGPQNPAHPDTPELPDVSEDTGNPAVPDLPPLQVPDTVPEQASGSNAHLIASQQLIRLPVMVQDFRFWTVARKYAFARKEITVQEEMKDEARAVGKLSKEGLCYILKEEEDGWLYVESGTVRGFVKAEEVFSGAEAQPILEEFQKRAREKAEAEQAAYQGIERMVSLAEELVPQADNKAFLHTHSTVNRTVVDKEYAVVTASRLNVREGKGTDSRVVGSLPNNSLCYILADKEQEWIYIESGDVRGFVNRDYIRFNEKTTQYVEFAGEKSFPQAEKLVEPEENAACYYTLTSVRSGVPGGEVRSSLLEFASQFIGNPYVWGGTSLTDGADCSGFVQSIYKQYGYDLPRVSRDQSQFGTKIPVEDAQPGDLIFYAKNGQVYHVVIYAGEGRTIEAMGTEYGIVQGTLYTKDAVWATRVLDDSRYAYGSSDIMEVNVTPDMYGASLGNFKLTYYCPCELCCDVETGITATGTRVVEGQTIAVDPKIIPYGTKVIIGGHIFTAEDCGGAIKQNRIDIYVNDHQRANELGVNYADVFLLK